MGIENFTELGFVTIPYHKKKWELGRKKIRYYLFSTKA